MHSMQKDPHTRTLSPLLHTSLLLLACLIVLADEIIKKQVIQKLPSIGEFFEWSFFSIGLHKNFGIAFDIPLAPLIVFFISLLFGALLVNIAIKRYRTHPFVSLGATLIVIGALGNFFDRLVYGFTVDYLLFFETSALNLSDFVILVGTFLLLFASRTKKSVDN